MESFFLWFLVIALLVCYVLYRSIKRSNAVAADVLETKGSGGTFVGWFEEFGISMVRGTNMLIFVLIIFAGVVLAMQFMSERNVPMAVLAVGGSFLSAGLVTGLLSMVAQVYESAVISKNVQVEILKELRAIKRG